MNRTMEIGIGRLDTGQSLHTSKRHAGRIGAIMLAGGMLLSLAACSRTSDGTIVANNPMPLPKLDLAPTKPFGPAWMNRKPQQPEASAVTFPTPPETRTPQRRKTQPPVVASNAGKLECSNVSEGGRVRMVCQ